MLKVDAPRARARAASTLQCAALRHLAAQAPHLALPRVVSTLGGGDVAAARDASGASRLVWMLTLGRPGRPLAEARPRAPRAAPRPRAAAGRDGPGAPGLLAPGGASRAEVGPRARGLDPRARCRGSPIPRAARWSSARSRATTPRSCPPSPACGARVIHGDAQRLQRRSSATRAREPRAVVSVIDFGDMHHGLVVAEPAVAAAYALLGQEDPLAAAARGGRGLPRARFPLEEAEIALALPRSIAARLAVSVANSARAAGARSPDDPYVTISEAPAWEALERLDRVPPALRPLRLPRRPAGCPPVPQARGDRRVAAAASASGRRVLDLDLRAAPSLVFDLASGSLLPRRRPARRRDGPADRGRSSREMRGRAPRSASAATTRRAASTSRRLFGRASGRPTSGRTVHLGIDLFVEPGSPVRAPLAGIVHILANNAAPQDYGPLVILRHETDDGAAVLHALRPPERRTRSPALARRPARGAGPGDRAAWGRRPRTATGRRTCTSRSSSTCSSWTPTSPAWPRAEPAAVWTALSPDPNLLARHPARIASRPRSRRPQETLAARRALLGRNLSLSYRRPLKIVRGWRQYLYDETGRAYLDAYNNVPLVGHCHPRVVRAAQEQLALLNTNTRYLHDNVVRYAERLTALLPEPLRVCFFVNSGQRGERAGAAPRARPHRPGGRDRARARLPRPHHDARRRQPVQVRRARRAGAGRTWVHVAPLPDDYRGALPPRRPGGGAEVRAARRRRSSTALRGARAGASRLPRRDPAERRRPDRAARPGYLAEAYRHVRAAGGVCIADEVQIGFGRLGTHFWGFETQGVVPDIVVLGKPIGNGFPLGAVVTTPRDRRRRSTTAWSSSARSAATPSPAPPAWPCSTCSRTSGCRSTRCAWAATCAHGLRRAAGAPRARRRRARLAASSSASSSCATARRSSRRRRRRAYVVEPPARARHPHRHRRPAPQRAQAAPAARLLGGGRGPRRRDARSRAERGWGPALARDKSR